MTPSPGPSPLSDPATLPATTGNLDLNPKDR